MTISNTDVRNAYVSGAGQTEFAYTFKILLGAHIKVYVNDVLKTISSDYTLSGIGDDAGGNVTFLSGLTSGDSVVLVRAVPLTQETDYVTNDSFAAEIHERALDKLTMIAQESRDMMSNRVLTLPESSALTNIEFPASSTRAGKAVRWNATGDALEEIAIDPGVNVDVITAKGDIVQGDASGNAAKLAIGYRGKLLRANDQSLAAWTAERKIDSQTASTVTLGNNGAGSIFLCDTTSNAMTIRIPTPTADNIGSVWTFHKVSSDYNKVTIQCYDGATTINGALTYVLYQSGDYVAIVLNTTDMKIIAKESRPQVLTTSGVVTQGNFEGMVQAGGVTSESAWDTEAGWSIAPGAATMDGGVDSTITQTSILSNGEVYHITYNVSGRTAGTITAYAGTQAGTPVSANGLYSEEITANGGNLKFTGTAGFNGTISGVVARLKQTVAIIPADDTDPQTSEGARCLSIKHRARAIGNRITINAVVYVNSNNASNEIAAVLHDPNAGVAWAAASGIWKPYATTTIGHIVLNYSTVATTVAETIYRVMVGGNSAARTTYIDRYAGTRRHALTPKSNMILTETSY